MAKQSGIIKLKGSIGDITFYKSQDGFLAREKGGVDKERFQSDPNFQRTRENASEFGSAGKSSKVFCTAIRPVLNKTRDSRMFSRLVKIMMQVIKADQTSVRGRRNVLDGELILLKGFEFNANAKLAATVYAPYTVEIDRVAGVLNVVIPGFVPDNQIVAPSGTTHFRFISAGAAVDFENETFGLAQHISREIPLSSAATDEIVLSNNIRMENSPNPLFVVFGIEFLQQVNGVFYALNNGSFNALSVVSVDTGV